MNNVTCLNVDFWEGKTLQILWLGVSSSDRNWTNSVKKWVDFCESWYTVISQLSLATSHICKISYHILVAQ